MLSYPSFLHDLQISDRIMEAMKHKTNLLSIPSVVCTLVVSYPSWDVMIMYCFSDISRRWYSRSTFLGQGSGAMHWNRPLFRLVHFSRVLIQVLTKLKCLYLHGRCRVAYRKINTKILFSITDFLVIRV